MVKGSRKHIPQELQRALARIAASQNQLESAIGEIELRVSNEDQPGRGGAALAILAAQRDELQRIVGRLQSCGAVLSQVATSTSIIERGGGI